MTFAPSDGNDAAPAPAQAPFTSAPADNGVGGAPATHEHHADFVPVGAGFAPATAQTSGNRAAQLYDKEHDLRKSQADGVVGSANR